MESLKRIEALPSHHRSSSVGQRGVLQDLRTMELHQALGWLEEQLASPVSSDWGRLLSSLGADASVLSRWLGLSKGHALAAADAAMLELSEGNLALTRAILPDLHIALESSGNPRLRGIVEAIERRHAALGSPLPTAELSQAEALLSNGNGLDANARARVVEASQGEGDPWYALFLALSDVYAVSIRDWRADEEELEASLRDLPVWAEADADVRVETVDFGNDEIVLVALTERDMALLKRLAPKLRFSPFPSG